MRLPKFFVANGAKLTALKSNEDGTTAPEFAMIAAPFFMFVFGLIGVSIYFFIMTSLDRGMDMMTRKIRTGEAQAQGLTVSQFKQELCTGSGGTDINQASKPKWINCNDLEVFVSKFTSWAAVKPTSCLASAQTANHSSAGANDKIADYSGGANDIVLVTVCYRWRAAAAIPFINFGEMNDGSMMMQTSTGFRSEPYTSTTSNSNTL